MYKNLLKYTVLCGWLTYTATVSIAQAPIPSPTSNATTPSTSLMTPEMVTAVGALVGAAWPVLVLTLIIVMIVVFRQPLSTCFNNIAEKTGTAHEVDLKAGPAQITLKGQNGEGKPEQKEQNITATSEKNSPNPQSDELSISYLSDTPEEKDHVALIVEAYDRKDLQALESNYNHFAKNESDSFEIVRIKSLYLYGRFKCGDTDAVNKLEEVASSNPTHPFPQQFLGFIHSESGNDEAAISNFEKAKVLFEEEPRKCFVLLAKCDCLNRIGKKGDAEAEIFSAIKIFTSSQVLADCYKKLSALNENSDERSALFLEKAAEYLPNDTSLLFSAAYALSNANYKVLAATYYKRLLDFEPEDATAWNNLAICYTALDLPILSIDALKQSCELNYALALCNLANRYTEAGFASEARDCLNKAKTIGGHEANLGQALSNIANAEKQQQDKANEIKSSALRQQRFFRKYINVMVIESKDIVDLNGNWKIQGRHTDSLKDLDITQTDTKITIAFKGFSAQYKLEGALNRSVAEMTVFKADPPLAGTTFYFRSIGKGHLYLSGEQKIMYFMFVSEDSVENLTFGDNLTFTKTEEVN